MRLSRDRIAALIPHRGAMCLLDEVLDVDETAIRCRTSTHRAADHPMRSNGRLGAACAIEYAAQAMALHDALRRCGEAADAAPSQAGMLVALRDVQFRCERIDTIAEPLIVQAQKLTGDSRGALYRFQVGTATAEIAAGRASVILDADAGNAAAPARVAH